MDQTLSINGKNVAIYAHLFSRDSKLASQPLNHVRLISGDLGIY